MMKTILGISLVYFFVASNAVIVKNDQKGEFSKEKGIVRNKECSIAEECRQCTFEELKHDQVCFKTAYKERYHCIYAGYEEEYYSESCEGKKKINPVYVMLIISICLLIAAWRFQKSQKESVLKNIFDRLSLFKEAH